ncbi:atlastin-2 [Rhipicephalus microplus]|uniref:atlastin-2 n=1 Tax=Rhipicephalus microplus TaxID=6941 RepID=UPI003F6D7D1A
MGGEPVQILRVIDDQRVEFKDTELQRILLADNVKDKPVVVISIAGSYRQGKSFFLSFFLRYLRSNDRSKWMEDTDAPLRGFKWRAGCERETTGIMVWNEVFTMTDSNGEEVVVLLMDTQGTFDSKSTTKESMTIFSLSMMTSSVQIYNVMNNIQEDHLQNLQFFAEYGRLAQKGNETRPFQKLLFLVRDWNWPDDYEFGFSGGRSLVESRLNITEEQAAELRTLRQSILSCFSEIEGFLLPSPGEKVVRKKSFDGRLADINEEFLVGLQELVPSILAPENLLAKQVKGKRLSCEQLMTFFRTYVEVFGGSGLPEPESVFLATAKATNVAALDQARKHYISAMEQRPRRSLVRLHEFHLEKLTEAKKVFDDYPKMGGDVISGTFMDILMKDLEELLSHFVEDEKEIIRKEQEEKVERERERQEQQKREEEMRHEQLLEKLRQEAREAELKREIEMLREQKTKIEQEQARDREVDAKMERLKQEYNMKIELLELKLAEMRNASDKPPLICVIS